MVISDAMFGLFKGTDEGQRHPGIAATSNSSIVSLP
jgi:hypothetical protein